MSKKEEVEIKNTNENYNFEGKEIEEILNDIIHVTNCDYVITSEMKEYIRGKLSEKRAKDNYDEFTLAIFKLRNIENAHEKLPYQIDKVKILNYVQKELINKKAFNIAMVKSDMPLNDPIEFINEIEILELLLNYLKNDPSLKEIKEEYKDDAKKNSYYLK